MGRSTIISNGASTSTGVFGTSTGGTGSAIMGPFTKFGVGVVHASTKQVSWKLQGSVGNSGGWVDLVAATSSTGSTVVATTAGIPVTRVRINVTGNGSTGNITSTWHVVGVVA